MDAEWRPTSRRLHAATMAELVVAYTEFATGYYRRMVSRPTKCG